MAQGVQRSPAARSARPEDAGELLRAVAAPLPGGAARTGVPAELRDAPSEPVRLHPLRATQVLPGLVPAEGGRRPRGARRATSGSSTSARMPSPSSMPRTASSTRCRRLQSGPERGTSPKPNRRRSQMSRGDAIKSVTHVADVPGCGEPGPGPRRRSDNPGAIRAPRP